MNRARRLRLRVALEGGLAAVSAVLLAVTILVPQWIEELTALEPDGGGGELEWAVSTAFAVAAVTFGVLASRDLARLRGA